VSNFEVTNPILSSPFEAPKEHWWILEGQPAEQRKGRRPALYFYREPKRETDERGGIAIEMKLVNRIREQVKAWRESGYAGVTRTSLELLQHWRREGREDRKRLFFAQLEAAETIIFLVEARADFRHGIEIPRDEPSDDRKAEGFAGFLRYACKMATGSGKTTVMGMLAAWSILNKVNDRSDGRFSDVVLVVVPNVTIRDRCHEIDPELGEASLYRTRDLVPGHLMERLRQGKVIVTNWHVFEPQSVTNGDPAKVVKRGREVLTTETIRIGEKNDTKRGTRFLTRESLHQQITNGLIEIVKGNPDEDNALQVRSRRYVETDTALINRILGREVGGKQNILVMNDEAHHAYRIKREETDEAEEELDFGEEEEAEEFFKEATVWIDGLDRIHKLRGINFCVDLSATPYFLGRVGQETNRPFPWVVSDFSLMDAIESGLVKIPQLAIRDTTGAEIPGYFNIWRWILQPGRLTPAERGGKHATPKPEAVLKWAHTPIGMLAGLWEAECAEWQKNGEPRPPVFILVCKNTALANVVFDWLANGNCPSGIPPAKIEGFHNNGSTNTIIVHSKVVHETDTGEAKGDEARWMRFTLDTVGKTAWPTDSIARPIFPEGFEDLANKLERPLHPPGRDVRCIVSVGMLTEGWDCSTVTHIIGLRPFMSQLLCEQVVGRGLRRASYDVGEDGLMREEVAKVFGVPFEVVPFKANPGGTPPPPVKRFHVHAVPEKANLQIRFPRVEGYTQAVRNRVTVDWKNVPSLIIKPDQIPPEVEVKGLNLNNRGRPSLMGPGRVDQVTLKERRSHLRVQELVFDIARTLTRDFIEKRGSEVPAQVLFPQLARIVDRYVHEEVVATPPADLRDLHFAPYYGWLIEVLVESIRPDAANGESPEIPRLEASRGPGSTSDVDFWTTREVREVNKSHLNYVVADTRKWEQTAAYYIDTHPKVRAFVKNAGLGFAIPYLYNGQMHDYQPDFIIRLDGKDERYLILETKGYDPLKEVKEAAANRWCAAVNALSGFGHWSFTLTDKTERVRAILESV
jgi:type III restriction enzyme